MAWILVPHDFEGDPRDLPVRHDRTPSFDEYLFIGNCTILYKLDKSTPNPTMAKFGEICTNLPGDVAVCFEEDEVPPNFWDQLPETLRIDTQRRDEMISFLAK